ncbi:MAG: hypothetical protein J6S77_08345 [Clostridia bacterium]|nr:hypothetical protein [Clostridia bacterium]MBO7738692.1 hypothetical protein [Clostridia bacterium]
MAELSLPLRASEVANGSEVAFGSEVSPYGEAANLTSLCATAQNFTMRSITSLGHKPKLHQNESFQTKSLRFLGVLFLFI